MSDNLHTFNDEILEQDEMLADLTALTATVNTNTGNITTINNLNIANKFAGSVSSGLKTLIAGNDTDIANIENKTDYITVTGNINLDTVLSNTNTNNSKVTYPSADATKVGRITIDGNLNLSTMSSNITTNTNGIDAIEVKTDNITCTQSVNLDTMESNISDNNAKVGITTSQANAITANTAKTGISTSQTNAITANTAKTGITTSQANAITANTAKTGISTSQTNAITANTAKTGITTSQANAITANTAKVSMTLGTSSSTALAGNTPTITSGNVDTIALNYNKLNMTSSSAMKTAVDANTSGVSALVLAYPRDVIVRHSNYTTADIYNDGTIKFNWDGSNKQLRFWVLSIGTNEYLVGGVKIWKGTTEIRKSIYISQNVSTAYKYFTAPQTAASASTVDNTYDLKTSYGTAEYFLCPYLEENYPTYEIKILIGYHLGWHTIHIKRFT